MRRKYFEIIGLAGLDPEDFGPRRGLGEARDQRRWRRDGVVALAAHLAQIGERPVLELGGARLGPLQEPRHLGGGEQSMSLGLERRQLVAANVRAAARHHHRRIPAQQR